MSWYAFAISMALSGQVAGGDRYGATPSNQAQAERDFGFDEAQPPNALPAGGGLNPLAETRASGQGNVSAPPPMPSALRAETPVNAMPANPRVTQPEDYGLGRQQNAPPSNLGSAATESQTGLSPTAMMRAMLTPPAGSRLSGQKVNLADVVAGAGSRASQAQRIDAYWDLCSSVADYYLGLREQDELQRLQTLVPNTSPVWKQAETELGVRIGTSQRAAMASQYRLASLMGRNDPSGMPLPGDNPHCGDYFVRYDQIFAGRPSPEAQELSELLPLRYEELRDAATAVTRAEEWLGAVASQRTAASDGTSMLKALELLALRRRAFVQIVRDYNRRIARYTELASPGDINSDRLIGMLIKRDGVPNTAARPAETSPPYNRQSQTLTETPRTFDEHWTPAGDTAPISTHRDDAVEPASVNKPPTGKSSNDGPRRERSLLVPSSR